MSDVGVLVVDDEEDIRVLLRLAVKVANEGLTVVGEASDGEGALALYDKTRPRVVVLDHQMPGPTGLETAERILARNPEQTIVLFSSYLDEALIEAADRLGVRTFAKGDIQVMLEALRTLDN